MATFEVISKKDAPAQQGPYTNGRLKGRMREYEEYIIALAPDEVGCIKVGEGETARSIGLRLSRAALRVVRPVSTWAVDNTVYFQYAAE